MVSYNPYRIPIASHRAPQHPIEPYSALYSPVTPIGPHSPYRALYPIAPIRPIIPCVLPLFPAPHANEGGVAYPPPGKEARGVAAHLAAHLPDATGRRLVAQQ